ncbi:MAG TPA: CPBP family intramembrane metalloprotease domain-containing protein [Terrisporobacter glycolicus]|uniref:CPBP family intramembrane glutamic endopeptidase n=1 Tax=Terrisporobacter TaxID=1505652 RepID=UPI000E969911|nr:MULTISPECIES: type II CAAX endopeptidase family protein [Terrisporobacter]HBI94124.1 CPBP family intramembrane metalloprotease domain-containing protein [Terrisporobacter hibernicus]
MIEKTRLTEDAKKSRVLLNFFLSILLAYLFIKGGIATGQLIFGPILTSISKNSFFAQNQNLIIQFVQLIAFGLISSLVFIWVQAIEGREIVTLGFYKESWLAKYVSGLLIGLLMMSSVVFILYIFGFITIETKSLQPVGIAALLNISIILIGWLIQGATEEIVTRGWLMNVLGARYNIMVGLILSSVFFALIHSENPGINYVAMLNIVLVGILLGLIVINTGSLWVACGIHSAWNFAQGNIFGFQVSGNDVGIGSIVDLNLVGNEFITGGQFGPEAGMVCSFVILALIVIMLFLTKRDSLKNIR